MSEHNREDKIETGSERTDKRKRRNKKMKYLQRWRQTTIANQILSVCTALMTAATFFLLLTSIFQYRTAREQTIVMQREVDAANRAADAASAAIEQNKTLIDAAQKQADASLTQANVSEQMAQQNEDLIESAKIQANTSQVSARAAESSARSTEQSLRIAEESSRGAISLQDISFPPQVTSTNELFVYITWANTGNSDVRFDSDALRYFVARVRPTVDMVASFCSQATVNQSSLVIPSHLTRRQRFITKLGPISETQIENVKALRQFFGFCGQITYHSLGKSYLFPFCSYYDPEEKTYVECLREDEK